MNSKVLAALVATALLSSSSGVGDNDFRKATAAPTAGTPSAGRDGERALPMPKDVIVAQPARNARRQAYFGDLHVHTSYSFDAFAFGTLATPYDAYRYAKGEAIRHPAGFDVQLEQPLDFYAVTDHGMFLGAVREAADPATPFAQLPQNEKLHDLVAESNLNIASMPLRVQAFSTFLTDTLNGISDGTIDGEIVNEISRGAWVDIIRAAEQYNEPGKFTTFVGYEYTTTAEDRGNLHRNVIFRGADRLPGMPFTRFQARDPAGLWDWMDK